MNPRLKKTIVIISIILVIFIGISVVMSGRGVVSQTPYHSGIETTVAANDDFDFIKQDFNQMVFEEVERKLVTMLGYNESLENNANVQLREGSLQEAAKRTEFIINVPAQKQSFLTIIEEDSLGYYSVIMQCPDKEKQIYGSTCSENRHDGHDE